MPSEKTRWQPSSSRALMVAALSEGRATNTLLKLTEVPAIGLPMFQLAPVALVRRFGRNSRYWPAPSRYMYGTSREVGVAPTFVWWTPEGAVEKLVAGAPVVPENTMFQLLPDQLPRLLSLVYHCCCDADST